jgi:hypothetical protein
MTTSVPEGNSCFRVKRPPSSQGRDKAGIRAARFFAVLYAVWFITGISREDSKRAIIAVDTLTNTVALDVMAVGVTLMTVRAALGLRHVPTRTVWS